MNEIRDMEKQAATAIVNADNRAAHNQEIQAHFDTRHYTKEELEKIESTAAITQLRYLRGHIAELGERVLYFRKSDINHACDISECKANITLAFRHLEDARMRLGKAIQSIDGGVSCYDKLTNKSV